MKFSISKVNPRSKSFIQPNENNINNLSTINENPPKHKISNEKNKFDNYTPILMNTSLRNKDININNSLFDLDKEIQISDENSGVIGAFDEDTDNQENKVIICDNFGTGDNSNIAYNEYKDNNTYGKQAEKIKDGKQSMSIDFRNLHKKLTLTSTENETNRTNKNDCLDTEREEFHQLHQILDESSKRNSDSNKKVQFLHEKESNKIENNHPEEQQQKNHRTNSENANTLKSNFRFLNSLKKNFDIITTIKVFYKKLL